MAQRYIKLHKKQTTSCFWRLLAWLCALLIGLGLSVVVWVVTGADGQEWVVLAIGGAGIVGFWFVQWFTGGGLPPIARFRILNESSERPAEHSSVKLNEEVRFEDEHSPPLKRLGAGAPNAAAYDLEPYEGRVESIVAEVSLLPDPEPPHVCHLQIDFDPAVSVIEDAEVVLHEEEAELVVVFRQEEEDPPEARGTTEAIPPPEQPAPPQPGPTPGPAADD
jgi:hypothetical protein